MSTLYLQLTCLLFAFDFAFVLVLPESKPLRSVAGEVVPVVVPRRAAAAMMRRSGGSSRLQREGTDPAWRGITGRGATAGGTRAGARS
jgi:hypothetical protein